MRLELQWPLTQTRWPLSLQIHMPCRNDETIRPARAARGMSVARRSVAGGSRMARYPGIRREPRRSPRACYELGQKSHRNADFTVDLVPSRSLFPAFLSRF